VFQAPVSTLEETKDWANSDISRTQPRGIAKIAQGLFSSSRVPAINGTALHLVSKWASHSNLATTQKYLHMNEDYEYLEMDKMLANEKANEKVVALDEWRKAS